MLLYLNDNYENEYNGKLEFWNNSLTKCEKQIDPIFNRIIIFDTINYIHGHPIPWNSDSDRISLAFYYYTDELEIENKKNNYSALWKKPVININNYTERHTIINNCIIKENKQSYLEIGVETGYTFNKINCDKMVGVDPDPKIEDERIIKKLVMIIFLKKVMKNLILYL